jgi:hypothetical protein
VPARRERRARQPGSVELGRARRRAGAANGWSRDGLVSAPDDPKRERVGTSGQRWSSGWTLEPLLSFRMLLASALRVPAVDERHEQCRRSMSRTSSLPIPRPAKST